MKIIYLWANKYKIMREYSARSLRDHAGQHPHSTHIKIHYVIYQRWLRQVVSGLGSKARSSTCGHICFPLYASAMSSIVLSHQGNTEEIRTLFLIFSTFINISFCENSSWSKLSKYANVLIKKRKRNSNGYLPVFHSFKIILWT